MSKKHSIDRRTFLQFTTAAIFTAVAYKGKNAAGQPVTSEFVTETQQGDVTLGPESIKFDPFAIQGLIAQTKASFRKRNPDFTKAILLSAQSLVGVSRSTDMDRVTDFLELFNLPYSSDGKPVPFCAAGLSYATAMSYLAFWGETVTDTNKTSVLRGALSEIDRYHFYPSASVFDMYYVAMGKRRWVSRSATSSPKSGWLVIYDWHRNGGKDHVGVVEDFSNGRIHTIEFNTTDANRSNGGAVARRTRAFDETVSGFIRTDIATFV